MVQAGDLDRPEAGTRILERICDLLLGRLGGVPPAAEKLLGTKVSLAAKPVSLFLRVLGTGRGILGGELGSRTCQGRFGGVAAGAASPS